MSFSLSFLALWFSFHDQPPTCRSSSASFSTSVSSAFPHHPPAYLCHILFLCLLFCLFSFCPSPVLPPSCTAFYSAAPLTSAGIIPIMQSLCPDGQRDEFGFLQYKNSTWVDFVSNYLSVFVLGAVLGAFFVLSELFLCLLFNFGESTDITLRLCSNFGSVWKKYNPVIHFEWR